MLTIDEIKQKLAPIFDGNGVKKAVLFGSYAKAGATNKSDIDLMIDAEDHIRGLKLYGLLGEIKDSIGLDVDLIVQRMIIENSRIDQEIKNTGVVIYERTN